MGRYEQTAQRIEQVLVDHRVNARVWEARVTPAHVRYSLTVAGGQKVDAVVALADEVAFALGVNAVRIERQGGVICVDVPRRDRQAVTLEGLLANVRRRRNQAALGRDMEGAALLLALDSPDVPHALVSGMTGSGKTELLRTMVASLADGAPAGLLQVLVCDVAGNLAGACPARSLWFGRAPATTAEECAAALAHAAAQLDRRETALPRIVVVVDELADLLMQAPETAEAMLRLTQRGRQAAVNVIAATQRPAAVLVGGMVKANFPVRIVGSVASPEDAKVASGIAGTGAEKLLGRGDFLLVARGEVIRFQAARAAPGVRVNTAGLERWVTASNGYGETVLETPIGESKALAVSGDARLPWRQPDANGEATIRRVYGEKGSLSATCRTVYGGKNAQSWQWVKHAVGESR